MMIFFQLFLSNLFLFTIEIGVLAFVVTITAIVVAVIFKIIKKKLGKTKQ
ncbi:MAG: hypothetical protein OEM79_04200 [Nitrosopumilus sp.]|nr:hypothetical protein [Nitrosopumilus sp.]